MCRLGLLGVMVITIRTWGVGSWLCAPKWSRALVLFILSHNLQLTLVTRAQQDQGTTLSFFLFRQADYLNQNQINKHALAGSTELFH